MDAKLLNNGPLASIGILGILIAAAEAFPFTLIELTEEDGPAENLTALLFFIAGVIFLWCARMAHVPRGGRGREAPCAAVCLAAWGILMIVFAGEEISWGQRIFGFETPEAIEQANKQDEFNVHNLSFFDSFGGTGTYVSIFMLSAGLVLPALNKAFPVIGRIGIPVPSLAASILFAGAYFYGVYFKLVPAKFDGDLQTVYFYRAIEIRELILAMATLYFASEIFLRLWRGADRITAPAE